MGCDSIARLSTSGKLFSQKVALRGEVGSDRVRSSGISSVWLERGVWDAEVARSNRVSPTQPPRPSDEVVLFVRRNLWKILLVAKNHFKVQHRG